MESLRQLERRILGWVKDVPHLPADVQAWLGRNIWIIVMVGSIIGAVAVFFQFLSWLSLLQLVSSPTSPLYIYGGIAAWSIAVNIITYVFAALVLAITFIAVKPLKQKSKKGWVILFVAWIAFVATTVINAVLSLNAFTFIMTLLIGATFAAISGYILFEVHAYFDHKKTKAPKAIVETKSE